MWDETGQVNFDDNRCATSETFAGAELDFCDDVPETTAPAPADAGAGAVDSVLL